jgi:cell division protein FtsN
MSNPSRLKFDHKEIAVIFSLFIFVSLLMFIVGILVGKGLTMAKYENKIVTTQVAEESLEKTAESKDPSEKPQVAKVESEEKHDSEKIKDAKEAEAKAMAKMAKKDQKLELIPQDSKRPSYAGLKEPKKDVHVMNNPKLKNILDDETPAPKQEVKQENNQKASRSLTGYLPRSFSKGPFTVQVGSYPNQKDAEQRVEDLKNLGFPYAFFSAKQIGDTNKWYRVYLGYYFEFDSAKQSSELLTQRGEVKNYLVRKTEDIQN